MNNTKRKWSTRDILVMGGIILVLAIPAYLMFRPRSSQSATTTEQTAAVSKVTVADTIQSSGSLNAVQSASLYWKTSGVVDAVKIKAGDKIKKGTVLLTLQPSSVSASVVSAEADLATAQSELQSLLESKTAQANAQLAVVNAQKAVDDAKNKIASFDRRRSSQLSVDYYEAQVALAQNNLDRAQKNLNGTRGMAEAEPRRAQAVTALYNAQQSYNTAVANLAWVTGKPTDYDVNLAEANLAIAEAQLADAQRQWEVLKNGPDPSSLAAAQAKVDAAQATVNSLSVIAPFDGEVIAVFSQPNDLVDTSTLAVIIANRNTYTIDAKVDETDITKIKAGQTVEVKLDALPDLKLTGTVQSLSLFGQNTSGIIKYDVFVSLESKDVPLPLGATANLTIQVGEPVQSLAVPITAVRSDDTGDYVLMAGGLHQRVNVQSGDIVGNLVAITGNLKEGDLVLLQSGASTTTTSNTGNNRRPAFFGP